MDKAHMLPADQTDYQSNMDPRLFFGGPGWGPGFFGPGFYGPGFFGPGPIGPGFGGPYYGNPVFQYGIPFLGGVITGMAIDNFPRYTPESYGYSAPYWEGNRSI
ncbi:hypothetical protein [Oceanobacillus neutriphilus]|uniref:Uncharacterized protein n=1 Tax=Oceanobacillus neutriphilus TaxID=531815 RepID=A0ABQ2NML4_9BACI|nr:hypothetical protein [Oceanobacillus neutriphilus]GGP07216.1 hypothetical protein GCM10011346_02310 [Oceanobacillus neutriphilus]